MHSLNCKSSAGKEPSVRDRVYRGPVAAQTRYKPSPRAATSVAIRIGV